MSGKRRVKRPYRPYSSSGKRSGSRVLRFRFKVVVVLFLLVTGICFLFYMMGANFKGTEQGSFTATWKEHPELAAKEKGEEAEDSKKDSKDITNPVPKSDARSQSYLAKCVFVGDSITVGLSDYQLVSMKNVIAEVGMNIQKINTETMKTAYGELTVLDALKEAQPENIYIMLGSNGIAWMDIDSMINEYSTFIDGIKGSLDGSNVYIIAIPPVTAAKESAEEPISNADIDSYNSKLLELANQKKCWFIDLNSELKGSDGKFPVSDAADDGMHFNKSTYDKMLQFVLSHVAG